MSKHEEELLKLEEELLKLEDVTGVGLGRSIIVYVKQYTSQMAAIISKTLNYPTRIIQTGPIIPLALMQPIAPAHAIYANRTARFRPAPGGVSVSHPSTTAGTLGCRAIDKETGEVYGVTNNHVASLNYGNVQIGKRGDPILQPGVYDGGTLADKIGELERWIPIKLEEKNLVDAALFVSDMLRGDILEVGKPDRLINPYVGQRVLKSGRSSGLTYSTIIDVNATVKVDYGEEAGGEITFTDQIMVSPAFMSPGDSGSWVGDADTLQTVGIGFAGSPVVSVANKMSHVERLLGVEVFPPIGYVPPYALLGLWGSVGMASVGLMRPPKS